VRADYPQARDWAEHLRAGAERAQDQTFQMIAERGLGVVAFHTGRFDDATGLLRQALDSYDQDRHLPLAYVHGYDHAEICSVFLSFALWIKGDLAAATDVGAFSISHSRRIGHMHSLTQALVFQSMLSALRGDATAALDLAQEAEGIAARQGFGAMLGVARFFDLLGRLMALGRPATAGEVSALHARWAEFRQSNPYNYLAISGTLLAAVCLDAGAYDEAEAALAEAEAIQNHTDEVFARPELMRQRARLLAARGDRAASVAALQDAYGAAVAMAAGSFRLRLACDLVDADPSPAALARLQEALDGLASRDTGWDVSRAQSLLGASVSA
jgi:predicted negative regulator of RcsB-dependent stress response